MAYVAVGGRRISYRMLSGDALARPTLVFLHEGLGSAELWRDFPDKVARRLHSRALVYSRFGYGVSDGRDGKYRTIRFMHEEALDVLPELLDALGIEEPVLIGHSDGASIALIHAATSGRPVRALALMAPHVFVEVKTVESIARITETYETSGLRDRLARYHSNVDDAFLGWSRIWLDPAFRDWSLGSEVTGLRVPTLVIQGEDDEYGTLAQIDAFAAAPGPVRRLVLANCGHSPHRDQEAAVIDAIASFVAQLG